MKKFAFFIFLLCAGMNVMFAQIAAPTLYGPSNNTTNMDVSKRLCVTKVSGANYYEIELDTTSNFNSPLKQTLNADTYYSYSSYYYTTVSNLLYGTKYYWRARCAHSTDTTGWSAVWNFTTRAVPQLYAPDNNSTNMAVTQQLCVSQLTGSNYYEIELDTTSNFNSPLKQILNADTYYSYSSYYYTSVSNLRYGTKYDWRARCAHSADTSGWSVVRNFTTRAVPQLYAPDNNSTNMAVTQQLCVSQLTGSNYYEIELDTTSNFNSPLKQILNADTYYSYSSYYYTSVSNLRYGTKYYWRARCANSTDTTGWSAVRNFTTRGVPQLYSPDNNSTNMDVSQGLAVTKLTGSNYYEIELDTTSNFDSPLKQTLNASSYNSSNSYYYTNVSDLLYGTKYYWRARCAHAADTSGWSAVWNFTTRAVPLLNSPSNNSTNMAVTQSLCVTPLSGSNYYEIELDTTSNFDSPLKLTLNADTYYSSYSSYYYTNVSDLLYGTKYYWRARCAHAADTSGWSAVWNFTTRAVPLLNSPSNNSTNMAVTQSLCVTPLSGSNYYEIELDTTSNFDSPLKLTLNADTYYSSYSSYYYTTVSDLLYGTKYHWRARCAHSADTTGWSAVRNFTTRAVPQLYSPSNNSTNMAVTRQLSVSVLTGSNYYEIELDTASNFDSPLKQTLNASSYNSSNSYYYTTVSNLRYGTKYYWRARCAHSADTSSWSAVWNFTTQFTLTAAPTLISPVNGATDIDAQNVTLTWNEIANATSYQYQVSTTSDFSNLVASGTTANVYEVMILPSNITCYWRVRGSDDLGFSPWSVIWNFSTIINCDDPVYTHQYATDCDSYSWHGEIYTETGIYYDTLTTFWGCDSIVALHLTINHSIISTFSANVCESDLPYHYVNGDIDTTFEIGTPNLSTFNFQFSTQHGCDSTVILTLNIRSANHTELTETACGNYTWNNEVYEESGDYTQTFTNAAGCDSVVTLHLTILTANYADFADSACGSYMWNGEVYTESGDYVQTFTNVNGCDSTVTLHLTIYPANHADFADNACGSYTWNDEVYTESGDHVQTFTNANGCDSVVTLHLTVYQPETETVDLTICENDLPYHYVNGDIDTTFEVGTPNLSVFNFQFSTQYGCDSTVILTLNIRSANYTEITETSCGSYTWNDEVYTESGDYVQTFTNVNGCDSVVTLHLTINTANYADFADDACGSYTWNDEVYTESGDYVQTFTNVNGCDSVVTLHLTIHPAVTELVEVTICENDLPYHYVNGDIDTIFEVGTPNLSVFNFQFSTSHGCDSVVTLHLTITTGVNEWGNSHFTLYPNPTTGMVNVQFIMNNEQWENAEIQVFDVYGRLLRTVETCHGASLQTTQIDLSQYTPGVYLIQLIGDGRIIGVRKVVKR